jgi:hypothetical protein
MYLCVSSSARVRCDHLERSRRPLHQRKHRHQCDTAARGHCDHRQRALVRGDEITVRVLVVSGIVLVHVTRDDTHCVHLWDRHEHAQIRSER